MQAILGRQMATALGVPWRFLGRRAWPGRGGRVQPVTSDEQSSNAGGLVRWPVKLILPLGFFFVALQGISEIIKCIAVLTTNYVREHGYEKPLQ